MSTAASRAAEIAKQTQQKQQADDLHATVEHLRAQLAERDSTIRKYRESRGGQIELAKEICLAIKASAPCKLVPYTARDRSKSEVALVMNLSDLHIGELIRPAETGGFGAFNYAIAEARADLYVRNLLDWVATQRHSYNIPDLTVFGIGDYISGDLHQELLVSNEFPLPGQTARAASLISRIMRTAAPHFRSVTFHGVGADNHGRLQKKPQAKQKAANNMSFLVHALVEAEMRQHVNFKLIAYEDMSPLIEVGGHNFVVTHGDTIKSVMGIPWYGLERFIGKEAIRRMGQREFHYVNCGHYHTPIFLPKLLMNGSLSGTTEFDHACGRYGPPAQISYLVHRKHGVFNYVAWKFAIEKYETDARRVK